MIYRFETSATMKEYNRKNWWIDSGILRPVEIEAGSLSEALKNFQEYAQEEAYITISNNALKNKNPMYKDTAHGAQQCGYVITGKCDFKDDTRRAWIAQYIDLWITIKIVKSPFEEEKNA